MQQIYGKLWAEDCLIYYGMLFLYVRKNYKCKQILKFSIRNWIVWKCFVIIQIVMFCVIIKKF